MQEIPKPLEVALILYKIDPETWLLPTQWEIP